MMNILLISPPLNPHHVLPNCVPLGIAYIASVIRNAGHQVTLLDFNSSTKDTLEKELKNNKIDLIGITVMIDSYLFTEEIIAVIKQISPEIPIVIGGSLVTSSPEIILKNTAADIAVLGEGEESFLEIIAAISSGDNLNKIPGICFKTGGELHFTPPRPQLMNLDSIPFPAFALFDPRFYFKKKPGPEYLHGIYPYHTIMTHRGCPFSCKFCFTHSLWPKISCRSVENIIAELIWQLENFGVKGVYFNDANFGPTETRIQSICKGIIGAGLNIGFDCLMRASTVTSLSSVSLRLLQKAGCRGIRVGVESGAEKILQDATKGISLKQIREAVNIIKACGFSADGSFIMIGHPTDTEASIAASYEFVSTLGLKSLSANFAIPLPGTPWYVEARKQGLIPDEVEFLRRLRFWQEKPIVNMTKVPTEKLVTILNELRKL
jgi:anaerobic magnesium-protoporphyrin IX monomethyl ester cyclase